MGRPILYKTSKEFLMRFGLSDLDELPSLKEFEQLARAALGSDEGIAAIEPDADSSGPETDSPIQDEVSVVEESMEVLSSDAGTTSFTETVGDTEPVAEEPPVSDEVSEESKHADTKAESAS